MTKNISNVTNYEGKHVSPEQVEAFRNVVQLNWQETLAKGPKGDSKWWNAPLLAVTEGRASTYDQRGRRTFFYSWCGDWVTYHLMQAGCLHRCLNRVAVNGEWRPGHNLTMLMAWAGFNGWLPTHITREFDSDLSAGKSWHEWNDSTDECVDGYEPKVGDLLILPRKNGDHIEFFESRNDHTITVSAGAQAGGVAMIRERDLGIESIRGVIDISRLAPSTRY